jgi:flavin-dependent dehydrogenase
VERAEVLIVGGGPAGSACATALVAAGRDVLVVDQQRFPRDKPCAGWITPEVVERLGLALVEYARDHTLQPISRFRVGTIGGRAADVDYGAIVSYGIRRFEFDAELLRRSGARTALGERVGEIHREGRDWVLDGRFAAPVLVGAGGHFCPVARLIGGAPPVEALVVAQEVELRLEGAAREACRVDPQRPELYFSRDLRGYGWCFRKGAWLNVGLGRRDRRALPQQLEAFVAWLVDNGRIAAPPSGWRGHAYLLREGAGRRVAADGVLLAGDAAGLAFAASGEGILPAVASGQIAALSILEARGEVTEAVLGRRYAQRLAQEQGDPARPQRRPGALASAAGGLLLAMPWFARHVVLDRWFLHRQRARAPYGPGNQAGCPSVGVGTSAFATSLPRRRAPSHSRTASGRRPSRYV